MAGALAGGGWRRPALVAVLCLITLAALPAIGALGGANSWTVAVGDRNFSTVVVDPTNTKIVYAAGNDSSFNTYVYKTSDSGNAWTPSGKDLGQFNVFAMAISKASAQTIFLGGYDSVNKAAALWVSTTAGAGWFRLVPGLGDLSIQALAVDPNTPSTVYLGTNKGMYKSTDGGNTFSQITGMATRNIQALVMDSNNPAAIYAGTNPSADPGVWKSGDGGSSWQFLSTGLPTGSGVFVLAADPANAATVYAGSPTSPYTISKTVNGGLNWTTLVTLSPGEQVYSLAVDAANPLNVYYSSSSGLFRSGNSGSSFSLLTTKPNGPVRLDTQSPQTIYQGGQGISAFTGSPTAAAVTPTPAPVACSSPAVTPPGSGKSVTLPTGHTVFGVWLDYLKGHGDVDNLGYPRTEVICDPITGQTVQYFQRVVIEWHPEQPVPNQLQRRLLVDAIYTGPADPPADPAQPPKGPFAFFPNGANGFGHFIANFAPDSSPTYFKEYFDSHGKEDTFGYPKEEPKQRQGTDGVVRWTQRLQAAVFEYHPENDRDGVNAAGIPLRNFRVQLELLGDEYIARNNLGFK